MGEKGTACLYTDYDLNMQTEKY